MIAGTDGGGNEGGGSEKRRRKMRSAQLVKLAVVVAVVLVAGLAAGMAWAMSCGSHGGSSHVADPADGAEEACAKVSAACPLLHQALAELETVLHSARQSADAGDAKAAAEELAKAQQVLANLKKACSLVQPGKPANTRCPMMGGKIESDQVKPELTRQFKGQTIAFCCAGCPDQWDRLNDTQKQSKLDQHQSAEPKPAEHTPNPHSEHQH
jgi:hypothetical protein